MQGTHAISSRAKIHKTSRNGQTVIVLSAGQSGKQISSQFAGQQRTAPQVSAAIAVAGGLGP